MLLPFGDCLCDTPVELRSRFPALFLKTLRFFESIGNEEIDQPIRSQLFHHSFRQYEMRSMFLQHSLKGIARLIFP